MKKNELQSTRQIKTRDTKDKILKSTLKLMNDHGYEYLTIRNICKQANVSTGTFYHHFKNKDDLMSYYLAEGYDRYKKENIARLQGLSFQERIIDVLTFFAHYMEERDIEFASSFYSTKNQVLNLRNPLPGLSTTFRQLVQDIVANIESAQKEGAISSELDARDIYYEINIAFLGTVFDWCLCLGSFDLAKQVSKMIKIILSYYSTEKNKV